MSASVLFKDIEAMLNHCAKGFGLAYGDTLQACSLRWKNISPHCLKHNSIELGHVRKMVRYLKIDLECAKKYLPI